MTQTITHGAATYCVPCSFSNSATRIQMASSEGNTASSCAKMALAQLMHLLVMNVSASSSLEAVSKRQNQARINKE